MKIVIHIIQRIIGIVLLSIYIFFLFDYDWKNGLYDWFEIFLSLMKSILISIPYFFLDAYYLNKKNLRSKSRASLVMGILFLFTFLAMFIYFINGLA